MAYNPRSGFTSTAVMTNGSATNVELPVIGWDVQAEATLLKYMNSLSGNHPAKATTFSDARFTIDIDHDDANQPFLSAGLNIVPGTVLTNTKLLLDGPSGTKYWSFPSAIVISTPQSVRRADKVVTRLQCESNGVWAAPGGTLF